MSRREIPDNIVSIEPPDILEHIADIDARAAEAQQTLLEERSVALGAVFHQLALRRHGHDERKTDEEPLLGAARHLLNELGLSEVVRVGTGLGDESHIEEMRELGIRIREERQNRGLTQEQFGKMYGVSRYVVHRAETKGIATARKLAAKVFGGQDR